MSASLDELEPYDRTDGDSHASASGVRVLVCDEEPLIRAGLKASLQNADIQVTGEFESSRALIDDARRIHADVILMGSGSHSSAASCADHAKHLPALVEAVYSRLAIIVDPTDHDLFVACVKAGIRGFISRQNALREVCDAVLSVARAEAYLSPTLTMRLLDWFAAKLPQDVRRAGLPLVRLTHREGEVLNLLGSGRSNSEIARVLHIQETTVRSHVYHILTKLGLRSRTEAALYGFRSNLSTS
jgi:DNA-binding NarL/FixJ family response regulator